MNKKVSNFIERHLPDAFLIALYLLLFIGIITLTKTNFGAKEILLSFGDGFWGLLSFSMQMVFILVMGHTLALSSPIQSFLSRITKIFNDPIYNIVLVFFITSLLCLINWGLGLVGGALLARKMKEQHPKLSFPLLIVSAYSGFLLWHGGLSGSVPLKLTAPGKFRKFLSADVIPLNETIFSSFNIIMILGTLLGITVLLIFYGKNQKSSHSITRDQVQDNTEVSRDFTKDHQIIFLGTGFFILIFIAISLLDGSTLSLNLMNLLFLALAMIFHLTPSAFLHHFKVALGSAGGIILQFPFYAGIMAIIKDSGLGIQISEFFVSVSSPTTFPLLTYLGAGILNFFVPSGGGQWAIQGPIILKAATELNVSHSFASMCLAWGDAWSNMIQPFWAIPLLSIAGLGIKDIMSYLLGVFLVSGTISSIIILIFGLVN